MSELLAGNTFYLQNSEQRLMTEIVTGHCQNEGSPQAPCLTTVGKPSGPGRGQEIKAAGAQRGGDTGVVKEALGYDS